MLIAAMCLLGMPKPAKANYFLGGWNNYGNQGVYATIKTCNPAITRGHMSAAYVMTCTNTLAGAEYIQEGWTKENLMAAPTMFWEWSSEFTGRRNQYQWGSPGVGGTHQYKISADSSWWNFYLDGTRLTKMPLGYLAYYPSQIQFFGEKELIGDKWGGTAGNPCTFSGGLYKAANGNWYGTYYRNRNSGGGTSTAGNNSNGFSIWNN